ncbi:hypothetical protein TIFTF001_027454 [Ficus carica]|uniref:Uncharacterized protein n=1 Tax=Ficus carica TaxID=3494 RepID=A0AA88DMZ7_FICCA|nr:hypothetical protein TIFTF001_027454 [Ficus carica]
MKVKKFGKRNLHGNKPIAIGFSCEEALSMAKESERLEEKQFLPPLNFAIMVNIEFQKQIVALLLKRSLDTYA